MGVKAAETIENAMMSLFEGKAVLRVDNRSVDGGQAEAIYEISDKLLSKSQKVNGACNKVLTAIEGVKSVSMVRQDDEINQ